MEQKVFRGAFSSSPIPAMLMDAKGTILRVNEPGKDFFKHKFGFDCADLGTCVFTPSQADSIAGICDSVVCEKMPVVEEFLISPGPSYPPGSVLVTFCPDLSGENPLVYAVISSSTEPKSSSCVPALSSMLLERVPEGLIITDADFKIVHVNSNFCRLMGFCVDELIGKTPKVFQSGWHDSDFYTQMRHDVETKGAWQGKIIDRKKNGEIVACWASIYAIESEKGEIRSFVALIQHLNESTPKEDFLRTICSYDHLTGLFTRHSLDVHVQHLSCNAALTHSRFSMVLIDIDGFSSICAECGFYAADLFLKEISKRLQKLEFENSFLARSGADEFVFVFEREMSDPALVAKIQAILDVFDPPFEYDGGCINSTASVGISLYPKDGESFQELYRHALLALEHARDFGNTFRFYSAGQDKTARKLLGFENRFQKALSQGNLILYYQPKIDMRKRRIVGAEALSRWESPEKGIIGPADFIPLAEETGFVHDLGKWVVEQACWVQKTWTTLGSPLADVSISVNLSPRQFQDEAKFNQLLEVIEHSGCNPQMLEFEITENVILEDTKRVLKMLKRIKDMGISLSVDDFGTGYSSLSYLKQLPVDRLKIDRSFIRELPYSRDDELLVKTIISMAVNMGLGIVAEGVENKAQLDFLTQNHCFEIQGFFFSRPLPLEEFDQFVLEFYKHNK